MNQNEEYSHSEIIHRCNFGANHLINARLSSESSLLYQPDSSSHDATRQCLTATNIDDYHRTEDTMKTFPTMLKLISGLLVGGVKYSDIYIESNNDDDTSTTNDYMNNNDKGFNKTQQNIPTLTQIARRVARLEKTQLDEKQYIAYEVISCTFLLGLVYDGQDSNTKLGAYLQKTMETAYIADSNDLIAKLKARGGRDQLLMFLTSPAGSRKSTAMKVAQQFCYEFCISVGIMWSDKTFLFTAYTGSAASLFGGVTISKAAFLKQHKQLSVDDINEWKDVQKVVLTKYHS
jgi:hypothetical protein